MFFPLAADRRKSRGPVELQTRGCRVGACPRLDPTALDLTLLSLRSGLVVNIQRGSLSSVFFVTTQRGCRGTLVPKPWRGVSPIGVNLRAIPRPKVCRVPPAGVWGVPKYLFSSLSRLEPKASSEKET